jgi:hypothetical protein
MITVEEQPVEKSSPREASTIVRLTLYPSQAKQFWPLLEDARNRTEIQGVLLTVNRFQDLKEGHLFLELQAARLDRRATLKIQELLRGAQKHSS